MAKYRVIERMSRKKEEGIITTSYGLRYEVSLSQEPYVVVKAAEHNTVPSTLQTGASCANKHFRHITTEESVESYQFHYIFEEISKTEICLTVDWSFIPKGDVIAIVGMFDHWLQDAIEKDEASASARLSLLRTKTLNVILDGCADPQAIVSVYYAVKRSEEYLKQQELNKAKRDLALSWAISTIGFGLLGAAIATVGLVGFVMGGVVGLIGFGMVHGFYKRANLSEQDSDAVQKESNYNEFRAKFIGRTPTALAASSTPREELDIKGIALGDDASLNSSQGLTSAFKAKI